MSLLPREQERRVADQTLCNSDYCWNIEIFNTYFNKTNKQNKNTYSCFNKWHHHLSSDQLFPPRSVLVHMQRCTPKMASTRRWRQCARYRRQAQWSKTTPITSDWRLHIFTFSFNKSASCFLQPTVPLSDCGVSLWDIVSCNQIYLKDLVFAHRKTNCFDDSVWN